MDKDEGADKGEDEEGEEKIIDDLSDKFEEAQKLVEDGDNEDLKTIFNEMKDLIDKLESTHDEK
jgi:prephenate dehydrogenase